MLILPPLALLVISLLSHTPPPPSSLTPLTADLVSFAPPSWPPSRELIPLAPLPHSHLQANPTAAPRPTASRQFAAAPAPPHQSNTLVASSSPPDLSPPTIDSPPASSATDHAGCEPSFRPTAPLGRMSQDGFSSLSVRSSSILSFSESSMPRGYWIISYPWVGEFIFHDPSTGVIDFPIIDEGFYQNHPFLPYPVSASEPTYVITDHGGYISSPGFVSWISYSDTTSRPPCHRRPNALVPR